MRAFETCEGGLLSWVGLLFFFFVYTYVMTLYVLLLGSLVGCVMLRHENTVAQLKAIA